MRTNQIARGIQLTSYPSEETQSSYWPSKIEVAGDYLDIFNHLVLDSGVKRTSRIIVIFDIEATAVNDRGMRSSYGEPQYPENANPSELNSEVCHLRILSRRLHYQPTQRNGEKPGPKGQERRLTQRG